jgi:hypothetical protein
MIRMAVNIALAFSLSIIQRSYFNLLFFNVFILLFVAYSTASAVPVPKQLVPLTAELISATKQQLQQDNTLDDEHQEYNQRAYKMLRQNGLLHWGRGTTEQTGTAEKLAVALGLPHPLHEQATSLQQFLQAIRELKPVEWAIRDFYHAMGEEWPEGVRMSEIKKKVQQVLAERLDTLVTSHTIEGLTPGQAIRIEWQPEESSIDLTIRDDGDNKRPPFQTTIKGTTNDEVTTDGKSILYSAKPAEDPIKTLNEAELKAEEKQKFQQLLGEWIDQHGHRWVINGKENALTLVHHYPDGAALEWTGSYSAGQIKASRKAADLHDTRERLPMEVRQQIISDWQPTIRVQLKPQVKKGRDRLEGTRQTWLVTYDGDSYRVKRIHTELIKPLSLAREATVIAIEFTEAEPPFDLIGKVSAGDQYRIRLTFDRAPGVESETVEITDTMSGVSIHADANQTNDDLVYLTDTLLYEPDQQGEGNPCPCDLQ